MKMSSRTEGDICVLTVESNRIDARSATSFKEGIRLLARDAPGQVVLDLKQVDFIDSTGLGALMAVPRVFDPATRLALAALTPPVAEVFRLTQTDAMFRLFPSVEEALTARDL